MTEYILGIETSCDDTSIAIVDSSYNIMAIETFSQTNIHALFGGVIPEIAARNHIAYIFPALDRALVKSGIAPDKLSAIAVTNYPGLIGCLLVGLGTAKGLAAGWKKPLIAINHLEGHIYSAFLEKDKLPEDPYLALVVSGGHTTMIEINNKERKVLGETIDDAAGEAFDKVAKLAGLGYPGGPAIDKLAATGKKGRYELPYLLKSNKYKDSLAFSFSGLKTAVRNIVLNEKNVSMPDLMADFQDRIVELIERRLSSAFNAKKYKALVVAGGVAANSAVRKMAEEFSQKKNVPLFLPQMRYCQDNGAMIAAAAFPRLKSGQFSGFETDVMPTVRHK